MFVREEVQERNVANGLVNITHRDFFGNPDQKTKQNKTRSVFSVTPRSQQSVSAGARGRVRQGRLGGGQVGIRISHASGPVSSSPFPLVPFQTVKLSFPTVTVQCDFPVRDAPRSRKRTLKEVEGRPE